MNLNFLLFTHSSVSFFPITLFPICIKPNGPEPFRAETQPNFQCILFGSETQPNPDPYPWVRALEAPIMKYDFIIIIIDLFPRTKREGISEEI